MIHGESDILTGTYTRAMILAASMVVRNELDRYLPIVLEHLRPFCDQITVLDDGSTDGTLDWLRSQVDAKVMVVGNPGGTFDQHEGHVRQALLEATLAREPTHVLAIDADELVSDGLWLRGQIETHPDVEAWTLTMTEVWLATDAALRVRRDGAWGPYDRITAWRVPETPTHAWRIPERQLACPAIPIAALRARARKSGIAIYHLGWADPETRQSRYDRYMRLDGGRFHARSHLDSIIWPEDRILTQAMPWPQADWVPQVKAKLLP